MAEALVAGRRPLVAEQWYGCYGSRGDLFTPESNRHPAKMAVQLCYRIFEHGRQRGYWKPACPERGDVILDPMAGIFTTGIVGATLGYAVVGVELELHFLQLARLNVDQLLAKVPNCPVPILLGGDARQLASLLHDHEAYLDGWQQGLASGAVTSPPYSDAPHPSGMPHKIRLLARAGDWHEAIAQARQYEEYQVEKGWIRSVRSDAELRKRIEQALEVAAGNYRARAPSGAVTSPPYAPNEKNLCHRKEGKTLQDYDQRRGYKPTGGFRGVYPEPPSTNAQGDSLRESQIGNLRDPKDDIAAVLSSPPYEDGTAEKHKGCGGPLAENRSRLGQIKSKGTLAYGTDNLGSLPTETYLGAMLEVYRQLHLVLKLGGVVCLVTKNPVKGGKIRRLDRDTIRLMETAGFTFLERQRAMLAEDLGAQFTLDGGTNAIRREHKSFFKRLFEAKRPDLAVNSEDVLWFRKTVATTDAHG